MADCPKPSVIADLVAGRLVAEIAEMLHRHILTCMKCGGLADDFRNHPEHLAVAVRGASLQSAATAPSDRCRPEDPAAEGDGRVATGAGRATGDTSPSLGPKLSTEPSGGHDLELPETLGRYRIVRKLGQGGMASVYLAFDTKLQRNVALKVPQFDPRCAEQLRARFSREAQAAARLTQHPNIGQVYDVDEIDGRLCMAMEYVEGQTLADFLSKGKPVGGRAAAALVRKIALAMQAAHSRGLVHRDLKPANIMLAKSAGVKNVEPKVMDFGLARILADEETRLTKIGMILGTPTHMSLEQWNGGDLGPASDVYSLGVILYELLTGALPYDVPEGATPTTWMAKLLTEPPVPLKVRRPGVDPRLEAICLKAMGKKAADRYASMEDLAVALKQWLDAGAGTDASWNEFVAAVAGPGLAQMRHQPVERRTRRTSVTLLCTIAAAVLAAAIIIIKFKDGTTAKLETDSDVASIRVRQSKQTGVAGSRDPDRAAAEYVLSLGGKISIATKTGVLSPRSKEELPAEAFSLTGVDLFGNDRVTDPGLASFRGCRSLTALQIDDPDVTDAGIRHFSDCKSLETLHLYRCRVSDAGVEAFRGCRELIVLDLASTQVTDAGLAAFSECTELLSIELRSLPITDAGLLQFQRCSKLEKLYLDGSRIAGRSFARLEGLKTLQNLGVSETPIDDGSLSVLVKCVNLRTIDVRATGITDTGLASLEKCSQLESAVLVDSKVTAAGVGKLRTAVPNCKIIWNEAGGSRVDDRRKSYAPDNGNLTPFTPNSVSSETSPQARHAIGSVELHYPFVYCLEGVSAAPSDLWVYRLAGTYDWSSRKGPLMGRLVRPDVTNDLNPPAAGGEVTIGLEPVNRVRDAGVGWSLLCVDEVLYCPRDGGIEIYDIKNAERPVSIGRVGRIESADRIFELLTHRSHLYAISQERIDVYDISKPRVPMLRQANPIERGAWNVACIVSEHLVVGLFESTRQLGTLNVYELSDPVAPELIGRCSLPARPYRVQSLKDDRLVAFMEDQWQIFSIKDVTEPMPIGFIRPHRNSKAGVVVSGDKDYVITSDAFAQIDSNGIGKLTPFDGHALSAGSPHRAASYRNWAVVPSERGPVVLRFNVSSSRATAVPSTSNQPSGSPAPRNP